MLHNQIQKDQTTEDFQTILTKKRPKANRNERLSLPKKTKVDDEVQSDARAETVEDEPGITYDFDYHDTINAETYEKKYFEKVGQPLKPRSVIIIDNDSYHSRNTDDFQNCQEIRLRGFTFATLPLRFECDRTNMG